MNVNTCPIMEAIAKKLFGIEDIKDIVDKFQIMSEDLEDDIKSASSFEQVWSLLGFSPKDIKKMKEGILK